MKIPYLFDSAVFGILFFILMILSVLFLIFRLFSYVTKKSQLKSHKIRMDVYSNVESSNVGMYSAIGKRASQQDRGLALSSDESGSELFIAVCDGMGGMDHGDYASSLASYYLRNLFELMPEYIRNASLYQHCIKSVDRCVAEFTDTSGVLLRSGTTLVSAYVKNMQLYYMSIGDSRLYVFENNNLSQVTVDQNYALLLRQKVLNGEMTRAEADAEPRKDALINYVGKGDIDMFECNDTGIVLSEGSLVMACSDGLTKALSDAEIAKLIALNILKMPAEIAKILVEAALAKGLRGQDNTTVALIKL